MKQEKTRTTAILIDGGYYRVRSRALIERKSFTIIVCSISQNLLNRETYTGFFIMTAHQ